MDDMDLFENGDRSEEWNDEERRMVQMAMFASNVLVMTQHRMMIHEMEVQTLESIWNMPAPEEGL
jgi:hypothetical protein